MISSSVWLFDDGFGWWFIKIHFVPFHNSHLTWFSMDIYSSNFASQSCHIIDAAILKQCAPQNLHISGNEQNIDDVGRRRWQMLRKLLESHSEWQKSRINQIDEKIRKQTFGRASTAACCKWIVERMWCALNKYAKFHQITNQLRFYLLCRDSYSI